jgi:L-asparaginase II
VIVGEVRSGLVEARHPVTIAAVDGDGRVVATIGEHLERHFYFRSAAKPFQAHIAQASGAGLGPEELAIASASHGGQPVHIAYVRRMLGGVGLDERALACPPAMPRSPAAGFRAAAAHGGPGRILHNCSGKHAGMLRACAAAGWPVEGYAAPDHPLQREIARYVEDVAGEAVEPFGVDGCGVPAFRGTVPGLARAFARLAADPDLAEVADAMYRFASLTSDGDLPGAQLARWIPGPAKGGARGCLGLAWYGGIGIAAKCWSGDLAAAAIGIVEMSRRLGILSDHPRAMLEPLARPAVMGGGRRVGTLTPLTDPA